MPYQTVWVEPEEFLEYKGVTVYHTYRDDDIDQGILFEKFVLSTNSDAEPFWLRELDVDNTHLLDAHPPYASESYPEWQAANKEERRKILAAWRVWHDTGYDEAKRAVLKAAIDKGLLKPEESV